MANKLNRSQTIALGVAAASLAALLLWQVLGSKSSTKSLAAAASDDDDGDDPLKKAAKKKASKKGGKSVTGASTPSKQGAGANAADEKTPLTSNARSAETKSLHSKIEEIDRRGKALFKGKK